MVRLVIVESSLHRGSLYQGSTYQYHNFVETIRGYQHFRSVMKSASRQSLDVWAI